MTEQDLKQQPYNQNIEDLRKDTNNAQTLGEHTPEEVSADPWFKLNNKQHEKLL